MDVVLAPGCSVAGVCRAGVAGSDISDTVTMLKLPACLPACLVACFCAQALPHVQRWRPTTRSCPPTWHTCWAWLSCWALFPLSPSAPATSWLHGSGRVQGLQL